MVRTIITELKPHNGRKSFYNKANVIECGRNRYLQSYSTIVCGIDATGKVHRFWNGRTHTTDTHINSFLRTFAPEVTSADFRELQVERQPKLVVSL